jgi:SET domain-containing protein
MDNNFSSGYNPLHKALTIKDSSVHGLGLFAKYDIPKDTDLGISHVVCGSNTIRTPLGGFYNHSDNPNCIKEYFNLLSGTRFNLITTKDIKANEEILVKYTLYKV